MSSCYKYSETCLNRTLSKPDRLYSPIYWTLSKPDRLYSPIYWPWVNQTDFTALYTEPWVNQTDFTVLYTEPWVNQTDFTVPSTKCLCNLNLCKPNTCLNWTNSSVSKGFGLDRFYCTYLDTCVHFVHSISGLYP